MLGSTAHYHTSDQCFLLLSPGTQIKELPQYNRATLAYLIHHLHRVAAQSDTNKMTGVWAEVERVAHAASHCITPRSCHGRSSRLSSL